MPEASKLNPDAPLPQQTASLATVPINRNVTRKRQLIAFLLLLMVMGPIIAVYVEVYIGDSTGISYLLHLGLALTVYFWCRYDAADARKKIPWLISTAIIVIPGIGFPIYKIRVKRTPMGEAISLTAVWALLYAGIFYGSIYLFYYSMEVLGII